MALHLLASVSTTTLTRMPSTRRVSVGSLSNNNRSSPCQVLLVAASKPDDHDHAIVRQSSTYQKHIWDYDFVHSLASKYVGEPYEGQARKLKEDVRIRLETAPETLNQLELIDTLQRLGLAHHFEDETRRILKSIFLDNHVEHTETKADLYATSLEFRLLRQHGHNVPQDVFNHFKDEQGNFTTSLCCDLKGMLYLYEASYFLVEGESILEDARHFTTKNLEKFVNQGNNTGYLAMLVRHALEAPLAWRVPRFEAYWFINAYESKSDMETILLELAKLDFNMLQATHQEDLKHWLRWWKKTGLSENLKFSRSWPVECFLWAMAYIPPDPEFGYSRIMMAKFTQLSFTLDDIYDVYGSLDELELLTNAIVRWDINLMDELPKYMKFYFLALFNSTNEMAYDFLKDHGLHIFPFLKKGWGDLSKSFLVEAKWSHAGYKPTLQEYLDNAWISVAVPMLLVHAYFLVTTPITKEALQCLEELPDMVRWPSMVTRLLNDLLTFADEQKRGEVPTSVQCYMHETGASKEVACEHISYLITETWKKMNKDRFANPLLSHNFIEVAMNMTQEMHSLSQLYGEGYNIALPKVKDLVTSVLIQPISMD